MDGSQCVDLPGAGRGQGTCISDRRQRDAWVARVQEAISRPTSAVAGPAI